MTGRARRGTKGATYVIAGEARGETALRLGHPFPLTVVPAQLVRRPPAR